MGIGQVSLSRAIRGLLLSGVVSGLQAGPALAQGDNPGDGAPPGQSATAALGEVEVTGTRIKRADVEAARPIIVIGKQQIAATGLKSIGDVLQTLASSGAAPNSQFNNGGTGRSNIDLRNLGPNRVLVLLNGHRVISGLGGDVDLNTIPIAIVDHIEILQDGASAVYGSDAISGVINIITTKRYDGAETDAYLGEYDAHGSGGGWDGKVQSYDFTIGSSNDKSAVVMNASYVNQAPVFAGQRNISKEPVIGGGNAAGSGLTPNGLFLVALGGACPGGATTSSSGACAMTLINAPTSHPTLANFRAFQTKDQFNYAPANYLVTPSERTGLYVQGHYDLADNLTFSAEVLYNERNSSQELAPDTLALGAFGQAQTDGQPLQISGKNPYNPFGVDLVANSSDTCLATSSCDLLLLLGRRLNEAGNRVFSQTVDNFQSIESLQGYTRLFGQEWDWDANFSYAKNRESNVNAGVVNTDRMQQELGEPGAQPCAIGAAQGCTPLNLFGGAGSITPAMLHYILFEQHDVIEQSMRDYTVNATGDLAELPSGPLGMALGAEALETDGFSHPDALAVEGNTGSNVVPPSEGRESTHAAYLEFDVPLASDHPFMKNVHLDVANRWSQFKWQGGTPSTGNLAEHDDHASSGNAALRWQANEELLLRASWGQGFRIPSISDLFLTDSPSGAGLADPCVVSVLNPKVAPFCGAGPYAQPNPSNPSINTTVGGNTRLTPERAISQTLGFVYSPDWLAGLDVSADYYKINLINAIGSIPAALILNGCYNDGIAGYCKLVTRSGGNHDAFAPGAITNIENLNTNIGGIKTEGVDLSVHYKFTAGAVGDLKLGLDWTFVKQYVASLAFGTGISSLELSGTTTDGSGTAGTGQVTGGIPKQRGNLSLNWTRGEWSANWSIEYISALIEDCSSQFVIDPASRCPLKINFPFETGAVAGNHIGATTYHDVQVGYHMDSLNTDLSLGVRNLFGKEPPVSMSAFANSFLPTYYRTPGRFLYASVSVKY